MHCRGPQISVSSQDGSTSTATSTPWFVGDFNIITVSFASKASLGASRFTLYGSNADGFQLADLATSGSLTTGWSTYTGVNMVGLTPGEITLNSNTTKVRWLRASVDVLGQSAASYTTIIFAGYR